MSAALLSLVRERGLIPRSTVDDKALTSAQFPDGASQIDAIEVSCIRFNHHTNTLLFDAHATLV